MQGGARSSLDHGTQPPRRRQSTMRHWQRARQGLQSFVLVVWILASCSAPGSDNPQEGCGGLEATVSCLEITRIAPTSTAGGIHPMSTRSRNSALNPIQDTESPV